MASKDGIFVPFDWIDILDGLPPETAWKAISLTSGIIRGTDNEDSSTGDITANSLARVLARDIILMREARGKDAERKRRKETGIPRKSTELQKNPGIDEDKDKDKEMDEECVSTQQPVENSKPVENTHTHEQRLAEIPESYLDYFADRVRAKGYKFADPEAALLSWWARDKDKPEWQKRQQMPSSFDTDDFFAAAVKASERRMP